MYSYGVLSGRLHAAFLEKLHSFTHESDSSVLPQAVPEYTLYEAALLGGGEVNMTFARYELMGALLRDTRNTWSLVESLLLGHMWGFPKIRGTLFWGPYYKDPTI